MLESPISHKHMRQAGRVSASRAKGASVSDGLRVAVRNIYNDGRKPTASVLSPSFLKTFPAIRQASANGNTSVTDRRTFCL